MSPAAAPVRKGVGPAVGVNISSSANGGDLPGGRRETSVHLIAREGVCDVSGCALSKDSEE
jgi:hypothetical protein